MGQHDIWVPVVVDTQYLIRVEIDEHPVFRMERKAMIDRRILFHIRNEFANDPLRCRGYAVYNRLVPSWQIILRHAKILHMQIQQILAKLSNLFRTGYLRIAKIELWAVCARLDKIVLIGIET